MPPPVAKKPKPPPYRGAIVDLWTKGRVMPAIVVSTDGVTCELAVCGAPMHVCLPAVPYESGSPWWWEWGPKG